MAVLKKNTIGQILFTMVDKTDFASVESGLTSNFTMSLFGVNHGAFAAASDITVSRSVSVVKSGVYKAELKAAETNWDFLMLKITHASAADQMIAIQTVDNDDADLASDISLLQVALDSDIIIRQSQYGDLTSDVSLVQVMLDSDVIVRQSQYGDLSSDVSLVQVMLDSDVVVRLSQFSDVMSNIDAVTATVSASDISDIASAVVVAQASRLSDILSAAVQTNSRVLIVQSRVSDVESQVDLNASLISDVQSAIDSDIVVRLSQFSDIMSNIDAVSAGTVTASDISDIASAVKIAQASRLSDILSAAVQANSRVLVVQSMVSDVESALDSDIIVRASQFSDIQSNIDAVTATVSSSDISDIASAVKVILASDMSDILSAAQQTNSRALVVQSKVSDVESQVDLNASMISDVQSAIDSQALLGDSRFSDVQSNIDAVTATLSASDLSDLRSAITAGPTDVQLNASSLSDIRSAVTTGPTDVQLNASSLSDLRSAITAGPTDVTIGASSLSDISSRVNVEVADVLKTDTVTLPGQGAPPLAPTFEEMISWLYKVFRNRTDQTSVLFQLYADNETTVDTKATVSDDGTTAIKQEMASGP